MANGLWGGRLDGWQPPPPPAGGGNGGNKDQTALLSSYGGYKPALIEYSGKGKHADRVLGQITEQQLAEREAIYRPFNKEVIDSVNSTELIDAAKATAGASDAQTAQRFARNSARYGLGGTPLERSLSDYAGRLSAGLRADNNINQARLDQYERNNRLRDEMIQVGRGIARSSLDSAAGAADSAQRIKQAGDSMKAQESAAMTSMLGSLAGAAVTAAMLSW